MRMRASRQRGLEGSDRGHRFVQADGGVEALCQTGVADQVVGGERLFQPGQPKVVEAQEGIQVVGVVEAVGGVGIGGHLDVAVTIDGQSADHRSEWHQVGAGLDLDLQPPIARLGQFHRPFGQVGDGSVGAGAGAGAVAPGRGFALIDGGRAITACAFGNNPKAERSAARQLSLIHIPEPTRPY